MINTETIYGEPSSQISIDKPISACVETCIFEEITKCVDERSPAGIM